MIIRLSAVLLVAFSVNAQEIARKHRVVWVGAATSASDNFNRASVSPMAGNWTSSVGDFQITGNYATNSAPAVAAMVYWNAVTFTADQYSEAAITRPSPDSEGGPAVRISAGNTGYFADIYSSTACAIFKIVSGTQTRLGAAYTTGTFSDGDIFKLSVVGTTLSLYQNGTLLFSRTDSDIASGQPGMWAFTNTQFDNWHASVQ